MMQALTLATRGKLTVSPNPMVGCVVVKEGKIIAEGWHQYPGGDHAEVMAFKTAKNSLVGSSVYVTLEPCSHVGRTYSCAKALVEAKVGKVIIAVQDPNPRVKGKGIQLLKQAGIQVLLGVQKDQAVHLNKIFFYFFKYKLPYVLAKWGMSINGKLSVPSGQSRQITGDLSRQVVHKLRNRLDAIMIGGNTVREDDPSLTVRLSTMDIIRQPLRIIISSTINIPESARVFDTYLARTLLITTQHADSEKLKRLQEKLVDIVILPCDNKRNIRPKHILRALSLRGVTSILLEGGASLLHSFFEANCVNEVISMIGPKIIPTQHKKFKHNEMSVYINHEKDIHVNLLLKSEKEL
jgi:diaminohydroxyphosphoribosylaminopyrimidine deaminase/5-amino-6-(5-phosphoribosylamino)uracil reductase